MAHDEQLADAEHRLREIDKLVYIRTPAGMGAYTHFMRDFDRIRELTKPWHQPVSHNGRE